MRGVFVGAVAALVSLVVAGAALTATARPSTPAPRTHSTLAVFGDAPFGANNADTAAFVATPAFIARSTTIRN